MAKKSRRRPVRHERDQSGCMWGLISMFDFRHGQSTQKLITDRRRGSKHAAGAGLPKNKLDMLTNLDENSLGTIDGKESTKSAAEAHKPSVKKLIEEEMFSEPETKKEINNLEVDTKHSNSEHGGRKKKNRKRISRTCSKSCEIHIEDLDVAESLPSVCFQNSDKQCTDNLDVDELLADFCRLIHQKSSCLKLDQLSEDCDQSNQQNSDFEEKLSEAIKLFISQKLINRKHMKEDGSTYPSEELRDAIRILNTDEEVFLKFLQGPNSIMAKYIQNLWNAQVEKNDDSRLLVESYFSDQDDLDRKQSDEVVHSKQWKIFQRKVKSLERNTSKEDKTSQALNKIVILKPGPTVLQNSEIESNAGTSPQSQLSLRNKGPNERVGSHFFLTELKRKLKHAMRKERQEISADGTSKRSPVEHHAVGHGNKGFRENIGRSSPSKDHFFIEKIARPPTGVKNGKKSGELNGCETTMEHETSNYPNQRVTNIYVEAKKHLSDMLSNGPGDVDFSSRHVPKTLGRILSLPDYNSSPTGSPRSDWSQSFVTAKMRLSASDKLKKEANTASSPSKVEPNMEIQSCISDDNAENEAYAPPSPNSSVSSELVHENIVENTSGSLGDEIKSEGDEEVLNENEVVVTEEGNTLDNLSEPSSSSITRDHQNGVICEIYGEEGSSDSLKDELQEESELPSSPVTRASNSQITQKVEDLDRVIEIPERPSPVSVLEPLFSDEDISPASTRLQTVELPIQPLKIQFEEHKPAAIEKGIHLKTCMEEKEPIFEYVKAVLQISGMDWDEFYMKSHSSEQLLDPLMLDEVEFFPNHLCCDKKLLFDCVNEALMEVFGRYFCGIPGLSFIKPRIRPAPTTKIAIHEVWEGVHWHLVPLPLPHTLDQIVQKDMAKAGSWMDLRDDTQTVLIEIGEAILEDLMEETILNCPNESLKNGDYWVPVELIEKESNNDL